MTFMWRYPLYLIPLEGGYVSVVDAQADQSATHGLAVFTEAGLAESFMRHCQILGGPRELLNAREFAWLLQSLRHPVTHVAFDPEPDCPTVRCRWNVTVQDLLARHLAPDNSPWNYPVFVLCQQHGFASIAGQSPDGSAWSAIGLFTSREKADAFLRASETAGTVRELADMSQTRALLLTMEGCASAVALDPTISDGRYSAAHCFAIPTLLQKYLVRSGG